MKKRILFLCIHNSARSQMAEAYMKHFGHHLFEAESAGLEAGKLNPFAVEAMRLDGIDISRNSTTQVDDLLQAGRQYDVVVTVCDEASAARCPVFPGKHQKLHWGFDDPSSFAGSDEERLAMTIRVRDQIRQAVIDFLATQQSLLIEVCPKLPMRDKHLTREFYQRIGFKDIGIADFENYLIMRMDQVELHFFLSEKLDPLTNDGQVYIRTSDADALWSRLHNAGIALHPANGPITQPWRQREFSLLDPDKNLLTFGQQL